MESSNEKTISIETILKVISARWPLFILAGAICAALAFGYTTFLKKQTYQSSIAAVVYNTNWEEKTAVSSTDITSSSNMINAIVKVVKEDLYLSMVTDNLNAMLEGGTTVRKGNVKSMVTATNEGSMLMSIRAVSTSKTLAQATAKAYENCLPEIVNDLFPASVIRITTSATNPSAIDKKVTMYTLLGFLVGAILVFGIFLVIELLDNTIKSEDDFKSNFEIPVLGIIPDIENYMNSKRGGYGRYGNEGKE